MKLIEDYVSAGYPILYVRTQEQERAYERVVLELGAPHLQSLDLLVWKVNTGLVRRTREAPFSSVEGETPLATDLLSALRYAAGTKGPAGVRGSGGATNDSSGPPTDTIYVMFNVAPYITARGGSATPVVYTAVQELRDAALALRTVGSCIIMIGGDVEVPGELQDVVTFVDFDLPTKKEIASLFSRMASSNRGGFTKEPTEDVIDLAAESVVGLPLFKAENAMAMSIVTTGQLDLSVLRAEKEQLIRESGTLTWVRDTEGLDTLGGFDLLKDYVRKRKGYFENRKAAEEFGIRPPKGILLVGSPGTGKTLSARCIAGELGLDLYVLDIGSMFRGVVGASEEKTRQTLKTAEALAPAVLLLDELEKALAGLESSGRSDSGVTSRVIGTLLTWMSESKAPLYKVGTANTLRNLDGAIFRRGRWDAVFGVDLPKAQEREQIFSIHLKKRGRDPNVFDLKALAKASVNFVGAEIESVVDDALCEAFYQGEDLATSHLVDVCKGVKPISLTDKEGVEAFRKWVKERATPVSTARVRLALSQPTANRRVRKVRS